ncbi:bifunctional 3-demethylubiquinol 3-O-methyltransferase/2-polyprenyl-6-hydroxyphenol methylase [Aliidiomarina minuta]|uniref:Ubiquinone biosynthesis O-methyltransferase n=1 Tax=Aliidiomarina minuta TaxID=880057 RepID=A0A432W7B5_9GAMM|nr:bifunctional 2-polyprenyl-6-hydroxyphenol methylase/3-demethylubiquinol 3-O-methyltransferase UbiG [Aliidiomarina minuta]RUO25889.1 bifunctional 3-demethylubiquinol 3-O-methyltransferase/2-polyprenyl-6-hydroxyphenol methylase [Aliidiomarina minuta]
MLRKEQKTRVVAGDAKREQELARFDQMAQAWWDPDGAFKHVLAFNDARLKIILPMLQQHFNAPLSDNGEVNLSGLRILDIGCGGGLISEALALHGASVTGIDGSDVSIEVAKAHARQSNVEVDYQHKLAEELVDEGWSAFDVVLNTEVIEHVADQQGLIDTCCTLCNAKGLIVMATLNRTLKSWLFGIIGAEYVLRLLPKGTHDWRYFVRPGEMAEMLAKHDFSLQSLHGLSFNPFTKHWRESENTQVNYLLSAKNNSAQLRRL